MRKLLGAIIAVLAACAAGAESRADAYLEDAQRAQLGSRDTAVRQIRAGDALLLAPAVAARERIASEVREMGATVGVEVLRRYTGLPRRLDSTDGLLSLLNTMASVSAMKDMTYWSATRGKRWVLFTRSYAVESPEHPVRVPDPSYAALPADGSFASFQEDTSFGKNLYRTAFHSATDHLWTRTENVNPISYLLVPVVPARGFVTFTLLLPAGDELLFYEVSLIRTSFPLGDQKSRADSLRNRVIAVSDWLRAVISR
jgi:hypothetical protein